jgi:hypothetical protein
MFNGVYGEFQGAAQKANGTPAQAAGEAETYIKYID